MKSYDYAFTAREVVRRVQARHEQKAHDLPPGYLETVVNDTLYHERRRLEKAGSSKRAAADQAFYDKIQHRLAQGSEQGTPLLLREMAQRFAEEIAGHFSEPIYNLTTRAMPIGLWCLLNAQSPSRLFSLMDLRDGLANHLRVEGEVAAMQSLLDRGTLVLMPTHSSHLDSLVLGYMAYRLGLPPLTYGAGLNLFTNPLLSFFMRHLGAYRVDRKKTANLYKEILKEYTTCSLELGYHNLFFPGGTRCRSGAVEQKLKMGLMGTSLRAYLNNLQARRAKPNIYIIPCTISYLLVLEAETLIEDYLQETGKSRYIIEDDEFSQPRVLLNFFRQLLALDARIVIRFSAPLDVLGNRVDEQGRSFDPRGRILDLPRFLVEDGQITPDEQRDAQYTRELAGEISQAYMRDNVVQSTNLVGFVLTQMLKQRNPQLDFYRLLRTGGLVPSFSLDEVQRNLDLLLAAIKQRGQGPHLDSVVAHENSLTIIDDAMKAWKIFHQQPAAECHGKQIFHLDRSLLLYYGNRLRGYELERILDEGGVA